MKGWVKGMLIGAAACVAAGSMVCVGAWAMGGRFSYFRNKSYGFVERGTGQEAVLTEEPEVPEVYEESTAVIVWEGAGEGEPGNSGQAEAPAGFGGEVRFGETLIRELEIEVLGGWVEVVADDSIDRIVVTSSNENYRCRQELDEDKLEIYVGLNTGVWQDWLGDRDGEEFEDEEDLAARIRIPAGSRFRKVNLEVKGGWLRMSQVDAQKLNLEVDAGALEVSGGNAEELDGECRVGELTYQGQVGSEMEAECRVGTIRYQIDGSREDFRYELKASAGSIVIDGEEKGVLGRENVIDNPGAVKKAKLECRTGAIDVAFQ